MGKGPFLPNKKDLYAAGIDPKTGNPTRANEDNDLKQDIRKMFRIMDEQTAINRFKWYNLPTSISGEELERFLYYKGRLCFFYMKETEEFYFMPFALEGTIDFYGRFNKIHPLPMSNGVDGKENETTKQQTALLSEIKLKCIYKVQEENKEDKVPEDVAVLLWDYSKQHSEEIIPRQQINEPLLDVMSECIPYLRTAMIAGTGIKGIRVSSNDEAADVASGAIQLKNNALKGKLWQAIVGSLEFQDLGSKGTGAKIEEYLMTLQSLNNVRLSTYGLENGGAFEKKAHELNKEADINNSNTNIIMSDGLAMRQNFCNIVNSIWNLGIWCDVNPSNSNEMDVSSDEEEFSEEDNGGTENDEL